MADFDSATVSQIIAALHEHIERRDDVIRKLQVALRPFAGLAEGIAPQWADERRLMTLDVKKLGDLKIGDVRRAAAADLGINVVEQKGNGNAD